MLKLSYENQLLLSCIRTDNAEDIRATVKWLLKTSVNWEEVLKSASWYGILPLLYYNLKEFQESHVIPEEVMDQLRTAYHANLARNMYLCAELGNILEAFHKNGLEVIVLKGAALAQTIYSDIGLRPMSDIDLLVKKQDLFPAERTISELGYLFSGSESPEWYRTNHQEICYLDREKNVLVEIHWHISNKSHPFRIRNIGSDIMEKWWEGAAVIVLSGKKTLILCPEDLIIHLCLHFLKHRFISQNGGFSSRGALIQIYDIIQTVNHYRGDIDWNKLKSKAEKYEIVSPIFTALCIVKEIMGENDDRFLKILNEFTSEEIDDDLVNLMNKKILTRESDRNVVPPQIIQSQAAYNYREKVKILRNYIFPNPEFISERYSVPLFSLKFYLYYIIRPFQLLFRYGRLLLEVPRIKEDVILKRWMSGKGKE